MQAIENGFGFPQVPTDFIRFWFGRTKALPSVELVADIVGKEATVRMESPGKLVEELQDGNHQRPYSLGNFQKVFDDTRFGRACKFPTSIAGSTGGHECPQWV